MKKLMLIVLAMVVLCGYSHVVLARKMGPLPCC